MRRVGIVGFGKLGQFIYKEMNKLADYTVAFVWNRNADKMKGIVPEELILHDLSQFASRSPDLVVEVAHPDIVAQYGLAFLDKADFLVGSPTVFADDAVYQTLMRKSRESVHGLFIASGALWGAQDIQKMADLGLLLGLKITMKKHPSSFKLCGYLADKVAAVKDDPEILYEGSVKDLCPLAPNNVNTMACAALAGHTLGFTKVMGALVADPSLSSHVIEVQVEGPGTDNNKFSVCTVRDNPAAAGDVTGKLTFFSFLASLRKAKGKSDSSSIQIC